MNIETTSDQMTQDLCIKSCKIQPSKDLHSAVSINLFDTIQIVLMLK